MLQFFKKNLFIHKLIFKRYSILRIMQVMEIKNLRLKGSIIDVGSKKSLTNISNFLNNEQIYYADKYSDNEKDIKIDLEKIMNNHHIKYDNLLLLNVLEHIFNYKNCLKNCHFLLKKNGNFYGSTPFLFRIHGSPSDFFRYTEEALIKILIDSDFKKIKVKVICGGLFITIYNIISMVTQKIPLLNNFLFIIFQFFDYVFGIISRNNKNTYPIGFFFEAKK